MSRNKSKLSTKFTTIALCICGAQTAFSSDRSINRDGSRVGSLEEITVTAQKREQNAQEVPVSITTFSAEMLNAQGIENPQDLQNSSPGLAVGELTNGSVNVSLRGIGNDIGGLGADPGVPIHIDGHYMQSPSYMLKSLFDVERVEVLRGPQGTLYGRNAVGGTINIISKKPTDKLEGQVFIEKGNFDKIKVQGSLSGPISEKLQGRIAIVDEKRDGYVKNITNGDDLHDSDFTTIKASLAYDLTDKIKVDISGYYNEDDSTYAPMRLLTETFPSTFIFSTLPVNYENVSFKDPSKIRSDTNPSASSDAKGAFIDVSWDITSELEFRSLSAYSDTQTKWFVDVDATDIINSYENADASYKVNTQEFQLLGNNDNLKWVAGLYFYREKSNQFFDVYGNADLGLGIGVADFAYRQDPIDMDVESTAVFGQIDYMIGDFIELTMGLRHTRDDKEISRSITFSFVPPHIQDPAVESKADWSKTTGKVGVNFHVDEDVMLYTSYATGYKAGGYNNASATEEAYDPETLKAFEVGLKSQWFEDTLRFNAVAFYYNYKDKQESRITFNSTAVENAGKANSKGIEIEALAKVTEGLSLDASIGYLSTEYKEFETIDGTNPLLGLQDLSGNELTHSPKLKWHLGLQYSWPLSFGDISARADYTWVDSKYVRAFNLDSTDEVPSYHRTNARITWIDKSSHWESELYVLNLEDDETLINQGVGGILYGYALSGFYLPPRTYGVSIKYNF